MKKYCLWSLLGTLCACLWPVTQLVRVIISMVQRGSVTSWEYPKYIIPYAPIALAVLLAVLLMGPLLRKCGKKAAMWASAIGLAVFLVAELLMENLVIVEQYELESWQMFMCIMTPESMGTMTAVEVLLGGYSPWFKLHFYFISAVIILSLVNVLYGFGDMVRTGDTSRKPMLTALAIFAALFLGLCIFACFTAFFREGELTVSPLSAGLMCLFFLTLGVTAGLYARSWRCPKWAAVCVAMAAVIVMYAGELLLLRGHLYRFGTGWFFGGLPGIVLAPVDVAVILLAGGVTWALCSTRKA